jgi:nucleotide-binding universal stress UspA family protein
MEAAAALAVALDAEVEGLFVEDLDLVNLAELALGHELHLVSGRARLFDRETLEDELRTEAGRTRRAFQASTARLQVRGSFRVVRGRVEAEVIAAAGSGDLLVLGTASGPAGARRRPGSTALAAAERSPRSVLLLRSGSTIGRRAVVLYDGSDTAETALEAALRLTAGPGGGLTVLLVAGDAPERAAALRARVEEHARSRGIPVDVRLLPAVDLPGMCRLMRSAAGDILVLDAESPLLAGRAHEAVLEQIGCPILIVR